MEGSGEEVESRAYEQGGRRINETPVLVVV
jgi:hypothetical protein